MEPNPIKYKILDLVEGDYLLDFADDFAYSFPRVFQTKEAAELEIVSIVYWRGRNRKLPTTIKEHFEIIEVEDNGI